MGVVDSLLNEHIVLHTTSGAYDPKSKSLVQGSVGSRKRGTRCVLHQADALVHCGHTQQNTQMKYHCKRPSPEQRDIVEPIVLEGRDYCGWHGK